MRERKHRFRIAIPPRHWLRFRANVKRARESSALVATERDRGAAGRERRAEGGEWVLGMAAAVLSSLRPPSSRR